MSRRHKKSEQHNGDSRQQGNNLLGGQHQTANPQESVQSGREDYERRGLFERERDDQRDPGRKLPDFEWQGPRTHVEGQSNENEEAEPEYGARSHPEFVDEEHEGESM